MIPAPICSLYLFPLSVPSICSLYLFPLSVPYRGTQILAARSEAVSPNLQGTDRKAKLVLKITNETRSSFDTLRTSGFR